MSVIARKVTDEAGRQQALQVLKAIYCKEKNWVGNETRVFDQRDLSNPQVSWFLATYEDKPVGVLRVLYEPPLDLYKEYGFQKIEGSVDIEETIAKCKIAEIGRFAILPTSRKNIAIAGQLMNLAVRDTLERGYTHYITDVFEGEKHSPYKFHTRVMGFIPVATHDVGELNCPNRRITMVLDLADCYQRIKSFGGWIFRAITGNWSKELHDLLENAYKNRKK